MRGLFETCLMFRAAGEAEQESLRSDRNDSGRFREFGDVFGTDRFGARGLSCGHAQIISDEIISFGAALDRPQWPPQSERWLGSSGHVVRLQSTPRSSLRTLEGIRFPDESGLVTQARISVSRRSGDVGTLKIRV